MNIAMAILTDPVGFAKNMFKTMVVEPAVAVATGDAEAIGGLAFEAAAGFGAGKAVGAVGKAAKFANEAADAASAAGKAGKPKPNVPDEPGTKKPDEPGAKKADGTPLQPLTPKMQSFVGSAQAVVDYFKAKGVSSPQLDKLIKQIDDLKKSPEDPALAGKVKRTASLLVHPDKIPSGISRVDTDALLLGINGSSSNLT